jgi:hypothetical protein
MKLQSADWKETVQHWSFRMANNELATTVHTAAMPSQLRSMVRQWYTANVVQGRDPATMVKLHASAAVEGVRSTGEAAVMGSILGAFHALNPTGLDVKVPGTSLKVPADAAAALLGLVGGVGAASAPHGMGKTVAQMGATCAGIYGFRMTNDLIVKMRKKKTGVDSASNRLIGKAEFGGERSTVRGNMGSFAGEPQFEGEDPILAAARNL